MAVNWVRGGREGEEAERSKGRGVTRSKDEEEGDIAVEDWWHSTGEPSVPWERETPETNPPGYNDWAVAYPAQLFVLKALWQTCLNKANGKTKF